MLSPSTLLRICLSKHDVGFFNGPLGLARSKQKAPPACAGGAFGYS